MEKKNGITFARVPRILKETDEGNIVRLYFEDASEFNSSVKDRLRLEYLMYNMKPHYIRDPDNWKPPSKRNDSPSSVVNATPSAENNTEDIMDTSEPTQELEADKSTPNNTNDY